MQEFRCTHCNKLLGKVEGKAEIKCPRCNTMNQTTNAEFKVNGIKDTNYITK